MEKKVKQSTDNFIMDIRLQKTWFYPGYISLHTSKFDYKLFPDKEATEVYNRLTDAWKPYTTTNLKDLYDAMIMEFLKEQGR